MKKIVLLAILVAAGCSPEIAIRSDYDKDVEMRKYTTYKWADIREIELQNNPLYYNQLTDKRIREAVNIELQNRGYIPTGGDAELVVHYHIIVEDREMIRNDPYGNYGPYWTRSQSIIPYKEGSIIIDIMEASTNNLGWRGWATSVLNNTVQIDDELIRNSIIKIFKKYPWRAPGTRPGSEITKSF